MSDSNEHDNDQDNDLSTETTESSGWLKKVEELTSEIAKREGCVLYDIEFSSRTLRIFIDKDPQAAIKDCENVSRGLSEILDEQDIIPGEHYQLEVSTPGLERILKKDWHFDKAVGKKIRIKTNTALENVGVEIEKWKKTKTIELILTAVVDKKLVFETEDGTLKIPLSAVDRAKVVFELEKNNKKKH
jgi:ribosome maturation factor RimP